MPTSWSHGGHCKHRWCPILIVVALFAASLPGPGPVKAHLPTSPTVDSAQVESFTGPDFVDFWWDPANIPGCATITLWRKAPSESSYTAVATPACGIGLVTDTSPSTGTTYSYQFVVQNDAEPPATIYLSYITATPG